MLAKLSHLNYRKGLFRLWVIGAVMWIVFAVTQTQSEIEYTVRYLFDFQGLKLANETRYQIEREELRSRLKFIEEQERARRVMELANKPIQDDYEQMLKKAGLPSPIPREAPKAYRNPYSALMGEEPQTPTQEMLSIKMLLEVPEVSAPTFPELQWLAYVFLPPPFIGLSLLLGFFLMRFVARWVAKGFTAN